MKKYIHCDSKSSALTKLKNDLVNQGKQATINQKDKSVEVTDPATGNVIEIYNLRTDNRIVKSKVRYKYVGANNGDYIQEKYSSNVLDYDSKSYRRAEIARTSEDRNPR